MLETDIKELSALHKQFCLICGRVRIDADPTEVTCGSEGCLAELGQVALRAKLTFLLIAETLGKGEELPRDLVQAATAAIKLIEDVDIVGLRRSVASIIRLLKLPENPRENPKDDPLGRLEEVRCEVDVVTAYAKRVRKRALNLIGLANSCNEDVPAAVLTKEELQAHTAGS